MSAPQQQLRHCYDLIRRGRPRQLGDLPACAGKGLCGKLPIMHGTIVDRGVANDLCGIVSGLPGGMEVANLVAAWRT